MSVAWEKWSLIHQLNLCSVGGRYWEEQEIDFEYTVPGLEKYNDNAVSYRYFYITITNEACMITNDN